MTKPNALAEETTGKKKNHPKIVSNVKWDCYCKMILRENIIILKF